MVQRKGKAVAETISPERNPRLRQQQEEEEAFDRLEKLGERNADKSPDEVLAEVTREVEAVRQERYEQRKAAQARRR